MRFRTGTGIFDDGRSALCTAGYAETARVVWSVSEETQFVRRVVGQYFKGEYVQVELPSVRVTF